MKQTAIATIAIGDPYQSYWVKYCMADWCDYANRINAELLVFHELLDDSPRALARSVAWQKCLLLGSASCRPFRQIAILDSDIAINSQRAPNIFDQVSPDYVGGVINGSQLHADHRSLLLGDGPYDRGLTRWKADQDRQYQEMGLAPRPEGIVQTGVLVANPEKHAESFHRVYTSDYAETRCYEQLPLSHALLSAGLFRQIDTRFNCVFQEAAGIHYPYVLYDKFEEQECLTKWAVRTLFTRNFFLHFASATPFMRFLREEE